ncbi:retrovirus-related pol polyprotein from transposon TNT 1-94 [Tanacetum coccineum]
MNKNKDLKAKMVSKVEVKKDESKPDTLCSKPTNESSKFWVKRALFTSPIVEKSSNLGATSVVAKSRNSWEQSASALRHNLFSVGQFCDGDLEVAFRSNTCYIRNLEGENLLTSSRDSALYTISISEMAASSPACLMSKATSTKSWLWHRRLSHLNFGTINHVTKQDLVYGLPKFKYDKDHLCSSCEQGKSKKAILTPKLVPSSQVHIPSYN